MNQISTLLDQVDPASRIDNSLAIIRVCMGGTHVVEYPLQQTATHETLRNIYCGHIPLPQSDLDNYNRLTYEINQATYHTDREFLLNQRHRFFVEAMYAQRNHLAAMALKATHHTDRKVFAL